MDQMTVEEHKQMMKDEAIPVLESSGTSLDDVSFVFDTKRMPDGIVLEMTTFLNGNEYSKTELKIGQLNG